MTNNKANFLTNFQWQNSFYLILMVVVLAVLMHVVPEPKYVPHGIILPASTAPLPASKPISRVMLLSPQSMIAYHPLARINIENHFSKVSEAKLKETLVLARKLAAKAGANGLVINLLGHAPVQTDLPLRVYSLQGTAVRFSP